MSKRVLALVLGISIAAGLPAAASAGDALPRSTYIAVGAQTLVPYGWVDFCNRYQGECDGRALPAVDINWTAKTQKIIEKTNSWVNANVKSMSDEDHWGVVDRWDYPTDGYGDCEDFVLYKRRLLLEQGFPRQALLVTVVKDLHGEGHALLTVKTNQGEFVLDNLHDEVKPWNQTRYKFVKRQSQTDQNVWVDIGEPTAAPQIVSR